MKVRLPGGARANRSPAGGLPHPQSLKRGGVAQEATDLKFTLPPENSAPDHMGPPSRYPHRLNSQPGQPLESGPDSRHPWAAPHSNVYPSVARIWSAWFAWTDYPYSTIPSVPWDGAGVAWSRSLDVAENGRSMATLLHRIADGTVPVWERAAWTLDGHGVLTAPSRRRTAAAA